MSTNRMQQFLKGVAKNGQFTFDKFYAPLPYEENTPMSSVCAAFVREYNKICDHVQSRPVAERSTVIKAAAVNIARLHEDTFGDARIEKYAKFNDLFFKRALVQSPQTKQLLSQLRKVHIPEDVAFDHRLTADFLVSSVIRGTTWPFRVVGNFHREANRRENIKIMSAIDAQAASLDRRSNDIKNALVGSDGKTLVAPTAEKLQGISAELAKMDAEAKLLQGHMDQAEKKRILSSMAGESVDSIDRANDKLRASKQLLEQASAQSKEMAASCKKSLDDLNGLLESGETIRAEVRAQAAYIDLQSKNVEEILRLRIETGETLSKSDIRVIESAHEELNKRMRDLDKTLAGPYAKAVQDDMSSERMKQLKARLEGFESRMDRIGELLRDPKVTGKFISEELKAKLKDLIDPATLRKISEALRSVFASLTPGK